MCDETKEERQDNELAALQAIFGDAVVDNRENIAWKVWRPLDLLLTLNPLHNSDIQGIHCSVTLNFKCCANYPDKPPKISINKIHGLSTENTRKLLCELQELSTSLCGEVMIFQLATNAQQFLHDHNKPTLSFYEEMLKQKNEMEQLKLHESQAKENEERQKIKDEIQRRQEMLRVAGRQRTHRSSISQDSSADGQGDAPELVYYADDKMSPAKVTRTRREIPCTCDCKAVQVLRVTQRNNKKIYIGNCLGHSTNGSITYLAIDDETGERLITKKWILPPVCDFQTRNRQQISLQADHKAISRLKNSSLLPYIALEMCKEANKRSTRQCVYLFRNFVLGSSLKFIKKQIKLHSDQYDGLRLLRHVGVGVLRALKELHSAGVLHRDVRSENVFIDDLGGVKLVGAALDSRLAEMVDGDSCCDRQTASQDIYSTGYLLLSIVTSERSTLDIPPELPSSAKDFFARCLTEDEQSQWSAEQLSNHVFLLDTFAKEPSTKRDDDGSGSEDGESVKQIPQSVPATNGHSRLHAEFEVLKWLGKGAFGDVLKVKNKLDGGFYAIKRIKLNPESVNLNKKITREVKLLSRLNHENVVRYYNAWIETTFEQFEGSVDTKSPTVNRPGDSLDGVVAKLAGVKVEWSMSEGPVQKDASSDSDSDDDDDEQDPWFHIVSPGDEESSEGIEFEQDSNNQSETIPSEDVVDSRPRSERLYQELYIQMEFCEKHTLRQAIDKGLYQEHFRAWRLFREIVEGLAHVHQRGMIHRDLKPVNIFLDSNDHVKIGDFGLATKAFSGFPAEDKSKPQEEIGGSLTGQIGTALYVAPELLQSSKKVIYNQKVDIYSLGIILFEMFHPLATAMERLAVLTELRSVAVAVNERFDTVENSKQIHVVRWLLNHEPSLRPTCAELLASEHVPRPVPEGALSGLLSHALSDRGARGYQRLIAACLDQKLTTAEDYTYHNEMRTKPLDLLANIKDAVIKIFRSHGATEFSPPILTPRAKAWDQYPNAVKLMTASGSVCHLPHDLRLPFARHTAYSGIKYMRRYCIDKVYRERHVQGFHPREILECAFDIVTSKTDSLWLDAELLVVASRAAAECSLKVSLQLNHSDLLRTLLLACGVSTDKHADIYPVLVDVSLGRITNLQLQTHLTSLCITDRDISNLLRLMESDVPVHELKELVTPLVKQAKWSKRVTHAIHQLEAVYRNAKALGCNYPITVAPFLASNATQHSGVFWQMCVVRDTEKPKAKYRSGDLIARGGRYDALVEEFWKVARTEKDQDNSELKSCSVGFSMSLERMAAILKKMDALPAPGKRDILESTLICICVWGTAGNGRDGLAAAERAQLALKLWSSGYTCEVWPAHSLDTHEISRPCIVLMQDESCMRAICDDKHRCDVEAQLVPKLWSSRYTCEVWPAHSLDTHEISRPCIVLMQDESCMRAICDDKHRVREHKVAYIDVLDFIKQQLNPDTARYPEVTNSRSMNWIECEKPNSPIISVTFITASDKMTKNSKRSCESQINTQITSTLVTLGLQPVLGRVRVCVVALACEAACVRMLSSYLVAPLHTNSQDLPNAARDTALEYPKRQNILEESMKELSNIVKQNNSIRSADEIQLYALYSIPDSLCRLVT